MSVLKVLKYPHPILRESCEPVTTWDASLQKLIDDMTETMYASPGAVGLAASQVGETCRLIILDTTSKTTRQNYQVLINPQIIEASRNKTMREGCLSFPEYLANIKRATRLTFVAYDRDGKPEQRTVYGLEAIAVQHEIDHLDGVLMIDRITSLKTDWIRRQPKHETAEEVKENAPSGNASADGRGDAETIATPPGSGISAEGRAKPETTENTPDSHASSEVRGMGDLIIPTSHPLSPESLSP